MTNVIDLDRRRPVPGNNVFEAHDNCDDTKHYYLSAFRDESDTGVYLNFCEDTAVPGEALVRDNMWLDVDQCEVFGKALLAAAKLIREIAAED